MFNQPWVVEHLPKKWCSTRVVERWLNVKPWPLELSRAVTRADAALLATPCASIISALTQLHPEPTHSTDTYAPRTDIVSPPLNPPANPLCDSLIIQILLKTLPHSSAADHGGWRYEHIMWAATLIDAGRSRTPDAVDSLDACDSFVAGRGALATIALIRFAFNGGIPSACRPWFLGGRLIALRKEGDSPALRKIRPITIGSMLGRVVSKCAAAGSTVRFAALFQPPTAESCASRPRTQTDGSPWPVQVLGVCCRNGTEIGHHALSALLDSHPTYIDVSLDVRNAYNSISRYSFMPLVQSHLPALLPWIESMYGGILPTSFMVIPHSPTSPLPKSYPKEALDKDTP